jgi:hypothetical protein
MREGEERRRHRRSRLFVNNLMKGKSGTSGRSDEDEGEKVEEGEGGKAAGNRERGSLPCPFPCLACSSAVSGSLQFNRWALTAVVREHASTTLSLWDSSPARGSRTTSTKPQEKSRTTRKRKNDEIRRFQDAERGLRRGSVVP